jgi:hypothetical protein
MPGSPDSLLVLVPEGMGVDVGVSCLTIFLYFINLFSMTHFMNCYNFIVSFNVVNNPPITNSELKKSRKFTFKA